MSGDDYYHEDRNYIYSYISYDDGLPPHYADPLPYGESRPAGRLVGKGQTEGERADDEVRGLVGPKAVFAAITLTALATMVVNPALLIYTLPLSTLLVTALAMAGRGKRRKKEARRLMP